MSTQEKKTSKEVQETMEIEEFTFNEIPLEEAKTLIRNHAMKTGRNAKGEFNNTVSVWFPFEQFSDFAKRLIDEEIQSHTSNSKRKVDGVRVYFANYGETPPKDAPDYAHKNTVVFISTYQDEVDDSKHRDYFTKGAPKSKDTPPENRGILCPPNTGCDCATELFEVPACKE